jgi:molecular chaperone HscB
MNYFELFGIPVSLRVDRASLTRKYFELSRAFHPDFFSGKGAGIEAEMLEKSSAVNQAYKTFQNPDLVIKYVLQLKGLIEEEEKHQLSPEFLMEVMELNEDLMDLESDPLPGKMDNLENRIKSLETEIYEPVQTIIENYQDGITPQKGLLQVKEYYFQKKYLQRLLDKIAAMRNIAPQS